MTVERVVDGLVAQLNHGRTLDELFETVYDELRGLVPYARIAAALLEGEGRRLRVLSCRSDGPRLIDTGYSAAIAGSTLEQLLATGRPRILDDLEAYLARKPSSESTRLIVREGMRSSLTLPLVAAGRPMGVLFFSSRTRQAYEPRHVSLLRRLAGPIAICVERMQLIERLQDQNRSLAEAGRLQDQFVEMLRAEVEEQTSQLRASEERHRLLVRLGQIINASLELQQVFEYAAEQIRGLCQCDSVNVSLYGPGASAGAGFGLEFGTARRWVDIETEPLPGTAAQWVMQHRMPRIARLLESERQFPEDRRMFERGFQCYVYLPLVSRDQSVGVLGVASRRAAEVDRWDIELLQALCRQLAVALDNALAYGEIARLKTQLQEQNIYLRDEIRTDHDFGSIIGDSQAMCGVREAIQQVAATDATVLVFGETGTGKELIARAIHDGSPRSDELLVKVNCAALAPNLIPSELFGHEAGAFTDATERRIGRFELANGGTIFLDEVSEIPLETQVVLLRVLQERTIERVGGNVSIPVDTRVIAATNRDLKQHVQERRFRDDLYYRLHVFPIQVPPLRSRREDIPALLNHFIARFSRRMNKHITRVNRRTMALLMAYHWPGNVRELENIIERAMIVCRSDTLEIDETWLAAHERLAAAEPEVATWAEIERQAIQQALQSCRGKVYGADGAAARLGLKPTTLYGKMRKLGISRRRAWNGGP